MSIYSDKLTHVEVVINCLYSVAQFCTDEDTLAYISGVPSIDDIISYNSLTAVFILFGGYMSSFLYFTSPLSHKNS